MSSKRGQLRARYVLGIDIGGTGIKGAPVDCAKGRLLEERFRVETPKKSTPKAMATCVAEIARHFKWKGPVGCAMPVVVKRGTVCTAANIDKSWIGVNGAKVFKQVLRSPVSLLNDADAAGLAEMKFGAGRNEDGLVVMITLGTGIGTALFYKGMLIPNSELGHLRIKGKDAERTASSRAKKDNEWSWKEWSRHVDRYLEELEDLIWPDLYIVGGGVSSKANKFLPKISINTKIVPAKLYNNAGIIGAALAYNLES